MALDPKKLAEILTDKPSMRPKDIEELLDTISDAIMEGKDLELPLDVLRPDEGSDERAAGLLTIPQEILDHVEQRGGSLEDHILGYLEAAIDLHNEGILLKVMVQLTHAADTDDFSQLADETGTGVRADIQALFKFLIEHDPLGRKDYQNALDDIKHSLLKRSAVLDAPEAAASWRDLLPVPENAKCHECGEILKDAPFLVLMGVLVSPDGRVVYGDGFQASDSDSPPGLNLRRGMPVCLECLRSHLESDVVRRMATRKPAPAPKRKGIEIFERMVGNLWERPENHIAEMPSEEPALLECEGTDEEPENGEIEGDENALP